MSLAALPEFRAGGVAHNVQENESYQPLQQSESDQGLFVVTEPHASGGGVPESATLPDEASAASDLRPSGSYTDVPSGTYVMRHWRGQLPLGTSYWANNFLGNIVVFTVVGLVSAGLYGNRNLILAFAGLLAMWLVTLGIATWQAVGTWRSAGRSGRETQRWLWPVVARIMIILGVLNIARVIVTAGWPQAIDLWQAVRGDPEFGDRNVRILRNGTELEISGPIVRGVAELFEKALEQAPNAHIVHLDSLGGRIAVARDLSDIIKRHGLDTIVVNQCASACTLVYLAGRERWITSGGHLGFHSGRFAGSSSPSINSEFRTAYSAANIPQAFIDKALGTASQSMWWPTQDELIAAGVVMHRATFDQFAVSGFGPKPSAESATLILDKIPTYQVLKKTDPEHWPQLDALWVQAALEGLPLTDFRSATHVRLAAVAALDRPKAPDTIAVDLAKLVLREIGEIQAKDPEACWQYLSNGSIDVTKFLSQESQAQEVALTSRLLVEVDANPAPPTTPSDGKRLMGQALQIAKGQGNDPAELLAGLQPNAPHQAFCPAFGNLYKAALAMPPADGAALIRFLAQKK